MLNHNLTTAQTPPSGLPVHKLYIYKAVTITHEYYFAITFDRGRSSPILLISDTGGVNIESSNNLHKLSFHLETGITPEIDAYIQAELGFSDSEMEQIKTMVCDMVRLFREKDATLLELNPLVRTGEGFVCLDAKFEFDNSARFRQAGIFAQGAEEGTVQEDEVKSAEELGLSYVRLEGNIGNIVNGAGLAMATNDLITLFGGRCANFLDVGGGATKDGLKKAFGILRNDERVKGVLINIYGGEFICGWRWTFVVCGCLY
jgi:succinyl-CoA synthetase beta subunit